MWMALFGAICIFMWPEIGWAAEEAASSGGGYLAQYENVDPRPSGISWWSTLAYLLSLMLVFAFVVVLAYLAARFMGGRFQLRQKDTGGRVLETLTLGPKCSVSAVRMAGRVFLLGITEQQVSLLAEITDPDEIELLERESLMHPTDNSLFSEQFGALGDFVSRFHRKS